AERAAGEQRGVLELGELLALGERLGERLAVELAQLRLGVEALQLARPAGHAQMDDALGLGREVRPLRGAGRAAGAAEQPRQGHAAQAEGRLAEETTAGDVNREGHGSPS